MDVSGAETKLFCAYVTTPLSPLGVWPQGFSFEFDSQWDGFVNDAISLVYTRVLTRVQLTSGREPSSNPPMDVG